MRTNVVLNDELMREAKRYSHAVTKKALIEDALRTLVRVRSEEQQRENYQQQVADLQRRLNGLALREAPMDILRQEREGR